MPFSKLLQAGDHLGVCWSYARGSRPPSLDVRRHSCPVQQPALPRSGTGAAFCFSKCGGNQASLL